MRGVPFRSTLKPGAVVYSSGLGGIYPRGIPVGVVLGEIKTAEAWARTYLLRPAVNPAEITRGDGADAAARDVGTDERVGGHRRGGLGDEADRRGGRLAGAAGGRGAKRRRVARRSTPPCAPARGLGSRRRRAPTRRRFRRGRRWSARARPRATARARRRIAPRAGAMHARRRATRSPRHDARECGHELGRDRSAPCSSARC